MAKDKIIQQLISRYPSLSELAGTIDKATAAIIRCYTNEGKLLICGNGGSSSDSEHFAAELMKRFESPRPVNSKLKEKLKAISALRGSVLADKLEYGLPAISLSANPALTTAILNDTGPGLIYAQQVIGYGKPGDILIGISTSGNSLNVIDACITAKALNMYVIGITGKSGGKMKNHCDTLINVPEEKTAEVQELQLPVIHAICRIIENHFFPTPNHEQ